MAQSAFEVAGYNSGRSAIGGQVQVANNRINFDRNNFNLVQPVRQAQFDRGWSQARAQVPRGLGRRGMWNSGVRLRREGDFGFARNTARDAMQAELLQTLLGFEFRGEEVAAQQQIAMDQLNAQRFAQRAQNAAMMRSVIGGN